MAEVPSFEGKRLHGKSHLRALPDGARILKTIFQEWLYSHKMDFKQVIYGNQGGQVEEPVQNRKRILS